MARLRRSKGATSEFFPGFGDIAEIGMGSLATVYRAREVGTNRLVALKLLNVRDASPRAIESFERESIALGAVSSHPNIVTLFRSFRAADNRPVLVLELCRGAISDRMQDGQGLPVADVVSMGIKIAGALETAHRAEILHRDVKPQNILITEFGEPALADFGVAMLQSSTQTTAGLFDFTTLHAAPELLEGGETSAATDVYELASSIYQLIAGKSAFRAYDGESPASVILRILRDPVQPLVNAQVPSQLSDLLIYAMSKEKDDRPPTASEFAAELAAVEAEQGWARTQFLIREPDGSAVRLPPPLPVRPPGPTPLSIPLATAPAGPEPIRSAEPDVPRWMPPAPEPKPEPVPALVLEPEPEPQPEPEPEPVPEPEPEPEPEAEAEPDRPLPFPVDRRPIRIDEDDAGEADDNLDDGAVRPAPFPRRARWLAMDVADDDADEGADDGTADDADQDVDWLASEAEPPAYPIPPAASDPVTTAVPAVPRWAFRAPAVATASPELAGRRPAEELVLDPVSLRRRVTIRAGASSLTVDEARLVLRVRWRRREIAWADVQGFEPRYDPVGAHSTQGPGRLVAVTVGGPIELPPTKRAGADLTYLQALLEAYRERAVQLANS